MKPWPHDEAMAKEHREACKRIPDSRRRFEETFGIPFEADYDERKRLMRERWDSGKPVPRGFHVRFILDDHKDQEVKDGEK